MRNLSNWRSVRLWESGIERELRQRHRLWLHGGCIGLLVLGAMWAAAHLQMLMGSDSLALRYAVTLGVGYLAYLGVLRLWAAALVGRGEASLDVPGDLPLPDLGRGGVSMPDPALPEFSAGGGGDFGGGGATADFSEAAEAGIDAADVAFGYVSARTAVRVVREGWLSAVLRLTWKPLLGALFCAVALGALIDHFIPQAHSLPQAVKVIKASR